MIPDRSLARVASFLFATVAVLAGPSLSAQTVTHILVSKNAYITQLDNTTLNTVSGPHEFEFEAWLEGTNLGSLTGSNTPEVMSKPGGSGPLGTMEYLPESGIWSFGGTYATGTLMNQAYGNGNFDVKVMGVTQTIYLGPSGGNPAPDLAANKSPFFPLASLSAGTISGGILTWNVSQPLTITGGVSAIGAGGGIDVKGMNISGPGLDQATGVLFGAATPMSIALGAFDLVAGNTYTVELTYGNVSNNTDQFFTISGGLLDGVQYGGIQLNTTTFTIQAIPEPSTYAVLVGLGAFALVIWQRRRAAMAA